jgi:NAD(P)-dependent dehydrogenase (short-subunit alcohol dehydrogenase family)
MAGWTAADMPDQSGRRVVVTGANSGIGYHAALELARHSAHVVLAVRDQANGEDAIARIRAEVREAKLELRPLDLADLASVRAFAEGFGEPLDLLLNNAGVMALPYRRTADGFEMQIGTNHLGHFALSGLLLERLLAGERPRVVTVASGAHRMGKIDFDDLQSERRYRRWLAYGQSKLANLLFGQELQRRSDAAGAGLTSVNAHPGYAATHLQAAGPQMSGSRLKEKMTALLNKAFAQTDREGALPTLYAATMDVKGGSYVGPDGFAEMRGHPELGSMSARARDEDTARRLWELSERLTGVRFEFPAAKAA